MPRRNSNVDTGRHRTPLELLPAKAARRLSTKARRRGWSA
jgi:hypothetical protein